MIAGRMRDRIRLFRPVSGIGELGGEKTTYEATVWARAERVKVSPRLTQELGELFSDYTVEWNIRDAHDVEEGWQVEETGGHRYRVANIIPNHSRGMLTLRCERINT